MEIMVSKMRRDVHSLHEVASWMCRALLWNDKLSPVEKHQSQGIPWKSGRNGLNVTKVTLLYWGYKLFCAIFTLLSVRLEKYYWLGTLQWKHGLPRFDWKHKLFCKTRWCDTREGRNPDWLLNSRLPGVLAFGNTFSSALFVHKWQTLEIVITGRARNAKPHDDNFMDFLRAEADFKLPLWM